MSDAVSESQAKLLELLEQYADKLPTISTEKQSTEEAKLELEAYEYGHKIEELALKNKELQEKISTLEENRKARKWYSIGVFVLIVVWLISIIAITIFNGLEKLKISDTVILALIGGTTANILGLFFLILKYLFNPTNPKSKNDK